ncbi:MAG: DUF4375 domain-containing protein [Variovorax sp.]|nr:MAG: DUF4375 domain-containing protein [Variovorax sp.]
MSLDERTWETLERRWGEGFDALWPEEQQTIALWWLVSETMNGGLDQFFWNSSGDQAVLARAGLRRLQLSVTGAALDRALAHFGPAYPENREARHAALNRLIDHLGEASFDRLFDQETRVIQDYAERCDEVAVADLKRRYAEAGLG